MIRIERLYHLAETANLASIERDGLLSTAQLLVRSRMPADRRHAFLRTHRPEAVVLPDGVFVRDQKPMPPAALAPALDDGLAPADWYALVNGFVFFWIDRERLLRQRGACAGRPQVVLTFDATALLADFAAQAFISPINSGNARRRPARRGRATLVPYATWSRDGWPDGRRPGLPAEVLFACGVPVRPPYLLEREAA